MTSENKKWNKVSFPDENVSYETILKSKAYLVSKPKVGFKNSREVITLASQRKEHCNKINHANMKQQSTFCKVISESK